MILNASSSFLQQTRIVQRAIQRSINEGKREPRALEGLDRFEKIVVLASKCLRKELGELSLEASIRKDLPEARLWGDDAHHFRLQKRKMSRDQEDEDVEHAGPRKLAEYEQICENILINEQKLLQAPKGRNANSRQGKLQGRGADLLSTRRGGQIWSSSPAWRTKTTQRGQKNYTLN